MTMRRKHFDPAELSRPQRWYYEGVVDPFEDEDECWHLAYGSGDGDIGERIADGFEILAMGGDE